MMGYSAYGYATYDPDTLTSEGPDFLIEWEATPQNEGSVKEILVTNPNPNFIVIVVVSPLSHLSSHGTTGIDIIINIGVW